MKKAAVQLSLRGGFGSPDEGVHREGSSTFLLLFYPAALRLSSRGVPFFTELSPALRELWKTSRKFPGRFFMFPRVPHLAPPPRGRGRLSPRRAVGAGGGLSALRAVLDTGPFAS